MLSGVLLTVALSAGEQDLLALAIERFDAVETYQATIRSTHADGQDHVRYSYARPGWVRIDFFQPHSGVVMIYDPDRDRARVWPIGVRRFPVLKLSPRNPLIRSPRGLRVDQSDVGTLLDNVRKLRGAGEMRSPGIQVTAGRRAHRIDVTGANGFSVSGVNRYELWLDAETLFPIRVISHDAQGKRIETVTMEDIGIDVALPEALFNP